MPRLILLGGLRLEDDHGPLGGRAAQKRRLALLALLGSPPAGPIARERLVGYIWPETGDGQARHSLSAALSDLRKELGEEVIQAHGDEVALNPAAIGCDAAEFLAAIDAGDRAAAVDLYRGPFLDGFFLPGAVDLERWVETQRERYAAAYRDALERLAGDRSAAGDRRGAVDAWRRLATEDPYSARVALGYMRALEAAGDRATALQFAGVHAALLREELEAEPEPEVMELARRLREAPKPHDPVRSDAGPPAPAAPSASAPEPGDAPGSAAPPARRVEAGPVGPVPGDAGLVRRRRRAWAATAAVAVVVAGLAVFVAAMVGSAAPIGVAVLPLENVGGSPDTDYFADGLTEEILNALALVEAFRVPARTTVQVYENRPIDVREAGRQLGVEFVVEGAVRHEADRLRISVRLVDARSGFQVWSESYDRRLGSVFDTQEEIARAIVQSLQPRLADELPPLVRATTRDPDAYDEYLKGRAQWYGRTPEALQRSLVHFERALRHDSAYARAYAGIADVYNTLGAIDWAALPPGAAFPRASEAARRALALDPGLAEGHAALATALFNYHWDWPRAEAEYRRALELNPGYVMGRHWYSLMLRAAGRPDAALAQVRTARELEPRSAIISSSLARHYYFARDADRAIAEYRAAIVLDPELPLPYIGLGMAAASVGDLALALESYGHAQRALGYDAPVISALRAHAYGLGGDTARARVGYDALRAARDSMYVAPHILALAAIGAGRPDQAVAWLTAAFEERSAAVIYARIDPIVDPLRGRSDFERLMERVEREIPAGGVGGR